MRAPMRSAPVMFAVALAALVALGDPTHAQSQTVATSAAPADSAAADTQEFMKQMPEPDRVIADIRGSDQLDTAARQMAALNRLIDVVVVLSGNTGGVDTPMRLTTAEKDLNGRYSRASGTLFRSVLASIDPTNTGEDDNNSIRSRWVRLSGAYGQDKAFMSALLQRYLAPELQRKAITNLFPEGD